MGLRSYIFLATTLRNLEKWSAVMKKYWFLEHPFLRNRPCVVFSAGTASKYMACCTIKRADLTGEMLGCRDPCNKG